MPFHSLNINISKQLNSNTSISFKATNLLDDDRENLFIGFNDETETFSFRNIGRTFSIGLTFKK
jgi:hypothetical protein